MLHRFRSIALPLMALLLASCASRPAEPEFAARLDALMPDLLAEEKAAGVGIAVIRDGEVVWTGTYGEQAPGVPVTLSTVFNTASIAKTITAETVITAAAEGLIDLDEPIAGTITDTSLSSDPRYALLTPRLLMSHRAGLLNWAYAYEDGVLAFDHDPDTRFSYSGAGVELAAEFVGAKLGKSYPEAASDLVLRPRGIEAISLGDVPDAWNDGRLAQPMDAEGSWRAIEEVNAALMSEDDDRIGASDDLLVTVPAYAKLLVSLLAEPGSENAQTNRREILTTLEGDPVYNCPEVSYLTCPDAYGHSIGWQVFRWGDHDVITHSGSDAGENALVHFSPDTGNGAVIFVNGANGWVVMTRAVEAIGDEPEFANYYRGLIETVLGREMPPLDR
ncbi:beta-lactamase family protein [Parvularcula sp. ZS-1/3]|uniref:Beta-lactamase family protein n=1 Tax=Parvularcula mediterranea TaxID=2732508 RepID=A0A7Y3W5Q3_9PROT|nr:serine hydrolase domain-containing protein [Parvularcula mediterranea]NNU16521.1 beta-lactamase family protein [Parvularcula mediterranea]